MLAPGAQVFSPQLLGQATVLGSGLNPLRVIQQEAYRQRAEQARQARAQADLEKQFTPPTPETNAGQLWADKVQESAKGVVDYGQQQYRLAAQGKITPNDAKARTANKLAEHNVFAKQTVESQKALDDFNANAAKNFLDPAKAAAWSRGIANDPTTGQLRDLRTSNFDPSELQAGLTNGGLINSNAKVNDFLDKLAQKQESEYTTAARPGQAGMSNSALSNIFANDGKGKIVYTMDARGNRVPKIANIQALEQAALQDPQMAALLRQNLENGQRPTASLLMGLGGEHVTDDQLEALNAQTNQNTPHERQVLADLIRPYGTVISKQRELSPMAVPQGRSGGKARVEVPYTPPTFNGEETRYNLPTNETTTTQTARFDGVGAPAQGVPDITKFTASTSKTEARPDYAVYGTPSPAPVDVSTTGKVSNKHVDAWINDEFDIMAPGSKREHRTRNTQPMSGYPGESHGAFVDAKTGKQLYPATTKEGLDMVRNGTAKLGVQFDFNTEKGENFNVDLKSTTEALMKQKVGEDEHPKYPTREVAEAEARRLLSTGTVRTTHLYTDKNAATIDRLFGTNYRKHQQALDAETAKIRAQGPASKKDLLNFTPAPRATASPKVKTVGKNNALGF